LVIVYIRKRDYDYMHISYKCERLSHYMLVDVVIILVRDYGSK
jgi:hypothetical protein